MFTPAYEENKPVIGINFKGFLDIKLGQVQISQLHVGLRSPVKSFHIGAFQL